MFSLSDKKETIKNIRKKKQAKWTNQTKTNKQKQNQKSKTNKQTKHSNDILSPLAKYVDIKTNTNVKYFSYFSTSYILSINIILISDYDSRR